AIDVSAAADTVTLTFPTPVKFLDKPADADYAISLDYDDTDRAQYVGMPLDHDGKATQKQTISMVKYTPADPDPTAKPMTMKLSSNFLRMHRDGTADIALEFERDAKTTDVVRLVVDNADIVSLTAEPPTLLVAGKPRTIGASGVVSLK